MPIVQLEVDAGDGITMVKQFEFAAVPRVGDEVDIGDTNPNKVLSVLWIPPSPMPVITLAALDDGISEDLIDQGWTSCEE
jgi:hypothetical protein